MSYIFYLSLSLSRLSTYSRASWIVSDEIHTKFSLSRISLLEDMRTGFMEFAIDRKNKCIFWTLSNERSKPILIRSRYATSCAQNSHFLWKTRSDSSQQFCSLSAWLTSLLKQALGYNIFFINKSKNIIISLFQTVTRFRWSILLSSIGCDCWMLNHSVRC